MKNPVIGRVSSEWATSRKHPVTGIWQGHAGIDIAAPVGTEVVAAFSGTVVGWRGSSYPGDTQKWRGLKSGNYVLIRNPDGEYQWYGHLNTVDVRLGQFVREGQRLGTVGQTGVVTGPHLHFETWRNSDLNSHMNPRILFTKYGVTPGGEPVVLKPVGKPVASKPSPLPTLTIPKENTLSAEEVKDIKDYILATKREITAHTSKAADNLLAEIKRDLPKAVWHHEMPSRAPGAVPGRTFPMDEHVTATNRDAAVTRAGVETLLGTVQDLVADDTLSDVQLREKLTDLLGSVSVEFNIKSSEASVN